MVGCVQAATATTHSYAIAAQREWAWRRMPPVVEWAAPVSYSAGRRRSASHANAALSAGASSVVSHRGEGDMLSSALASAGCHEEVGR